MTYIISLPTYTGPYDLILLFIQRDELDIYDLPIAKITHDFLEHLKTLEEMNIEVASEFILVAATLMRIKAKMLIPRKELDEAGNEIDPREELVQRLLEYKRYKSILEDMRDMEDARFKIEPRGNTHEELKQIATKVLVDSELESLTLYKLLQAFEKVMLRFEDRTSKPVHTIVQYDYTVKNQKDYLKNVVFKLARASFAQVFDSCENRIHAIVTFLALLELLQLQELDIVLGEGVNNFFITAIDNNSENGR